MVGRNLEPNIAYKLESFLSDNEQLENIKSKKFQICYGNKAGKLGQVVMQLNFFFHIFRFLNFLAYFIFDRQSKI